MYYIYKITCILNNKIYIGKGKVRTKVCKVEDDHYFGSGVYIKRAINKHGKKNFVKEVLEYIEEEKTAYEKEKYYISLYDSCNLKKGYNFHGGGTGFDSTTSYKALDVLYSKDEDFLLKLKDKRKEALQSPEVKEKISKASKEYHASKTEEQKRQTSEKIKAYYDKGGREKKREQVNKLKNDPAYRKKLSDGVRKAQQEPSYKENHSKAMHKLYKEGSQQEKIKKAMGDPLLVERNKLYAGQISAITRLYRSGKISEDEYNKRREPLLKWKEDWDKRYKEHLSLKNEEIRNEND